MGKCVECKETKPTPYADGHLCEDCFREMLKEGK